MSNPDFHTSEGFISKAFKGAAVVIPTATP
jgi:hypothetical protein